MNLTLPYIILYLILRSISFFALLGMSKGLSWEYDGCEFDMTFKIYSSVNLSNLSLFDWFTAYIHLSLLIVEGLHAMDLIEKNLDQFTRKEKLRMNEEMTQQ